MKHIVRALALMLIFAGAIAFMSKNIKEETIVFEKTVQMGRASFPVVEAKSGNYTMNLLHGYSTNLDCSLIRETITPLDGEKSFDVLITENQSDVKKLKFELRSTEESKLLDSGSISALDMTDGKKSARIRLSAEIDQGKEYALKITLITAEGKKINYYTRVKQYMEDSFLARKMDFVMNFHEDVMDKKKAKKLIKYLEQEPGADNTNLAYVDIHSDFDTFSWGSLEPEVITQVVPSVIEYNIETAAIELSYFVKADAGSSRKEIYQVKEFFRVRCTTDRMYLLYYQRRMEALFDIDLFSMAKSEIKIGITNDKNMELVTTGDNNKLCFVRQGALWYYNLAENQAVRVFSFLGEEEPDYIREGYDQHDIKILNLSEDGNIDFLVYGYMNSGDYEGKVGAVLYKFYAGEKRIEEQVYLPMETTYQMLRLDLKDFNYVNQKGVYFFTMGKNIYAYNIVARKLSCIVENTNDGSYMMSEEGRYMVWQDSPMAGESKKITLLDLESEERKEIEAPSGENIKLLGCIDEKFIYGLIKSQDFRETADGSMIEPMYQVRIADNEANTLKTYEMKNKYVTGIKIKDNIIVLERVEEKEKEGIPYYKKIKPDHLMNWGTESQESIGLTERITDLAMTEYYISLPAGFKIAEKPAVALTVNTIITEDTTLHIDEEREKKYYVYAFGSIQEAHINAAEAIIAADEKMGVVVNQDFGIIWERGGKYNRKSIETLKPVYASNGADSIEACIAMVLEYNQIKASNKDLSGSRKSIYDTLKKNLNKEPVNLTGCTLDEVLYFVSSGRPVISMKDREYAVLIKGYNETYVEIFDPGAMTESKRTYAAAEEMFEDAGNIFVSYIE